jgi:hypothetical protein
VADQALAGEAAMAGRVSNPEISGFRHHCQRQYQRYGEDFVYAEGFSVVWRAQFTGS